MDAKGERYGIRVAKVAGKCTAAQRFNRVVNAEIAYNAWIGWRGLRSLLTVRAVKHQNKS